MIVDFPDDDGSRQVQIGKLSVGRTYGLWDVAVFLQRAGLTWDEDEIARSDRIEWRGGGPDVWVVPERRPGRPMAAM
ncbi:hypothetical protein MUK60_00380 [Streptomyces sp. LRE541]|uniref:hypothetical protein n=1 Tax=Streptomyces sp. LRE541 TaxID=2931983 RepID=UPI00200F4BE2|nr:hypothetical protein [Streptomyces sp. LRE541]UPZ26407.1 hypothetical protein MUK60_00380 [Streptomyces sp. LRE541]